MLEVLLVVSCHRLFPLAKSHSSDLEPYASPGLSECERRNLFHPAVGIEGSRYVNAVGSEFGGMKLQLGQLVHYRLDPAQREKFPASAAPGIFAGWRFDSGPSSFREVYHILDYDKLKNREPGYEKAISVPREELHVPRENPILPMFTAAESALSGFTQVEYEAIDFLDVPFSAVAPSTPVAKRHEYITLDRLIRLGATPACKACKFDAVVHTPACKARFDGLNQDREDCSEQVSQRRGTARC